MATAAEILKDPNYLNANPATKQAIFDRHIAATPDYANANEPTRAAIRQRFGLAAAVPPSEAPEKPQAPREYGLLEVPGAALGNLPASGAKLVEGAAQAVLHLDDTLMGIRDVLSGGVVLALPKAAQDKLRAVVTDKAALDRMVKAARAFGGVYADRYGGYENIKRTLAEDPVGALADFSALTGGTAAATSRVAPKAAAALEKASVVTNPMRPVGAVVAVPVKLAGKGVGAVYNALNPKARAYMEAANGQEGQLINAMRDPGLEIIKGSKPTAAQAASEAGATKFSAMGEASAKVLPDDYYKRAAQQDAARLQALRTITGAPGDLKNVTDWRAANAAKNYAAAFAKQVRGDKALADMADNPYFEAAIPAADDLAKANRITFKSNPVQYLHYVKIGLDKALGRTGDSALTKTERGAVEAVRQQLIGWLEDPKRAPEYKNAREMFARQSRPINQMEIGQFLEGKLTSALDEEAPQRAAVFANAVRDAPGTIKRATGGGGPRYERLDQVLTPTQLATVDGIKADLARAAKTKGQAKAAGGHPEIEQIVSQVTKAPNLLTPILTLANYVMKKIAGHMDRKIAIQIATEMLDPKLAADALEKAAKYQRRGEMVGKGAAMAGEHFRQNVTGRTTLGGAQINNAMRDESRNRMGQ